jgi:hypothetical protein
MKLLKPSEISARILTLLDESDDKVILVSPYMKISKWYRFANKIMDLRARGINLEIYVRDDPDNTNTYSDLDQLELDYQKIPHLHSKFYLNEKYGIVSSMNLLLSSEINSLEIGYVTETWTEYDELFQYYNRYICGGEPVQNVATAGQAYTDLSILMQSIREELQTKTMNAWLWLSENVLHINTGKNNYHISINESYLKITACVRIDLGSNQKNMLSSTLLRKKIEDLSTIKIQMNTTPMSGTLELFGKAQRTLKSTCMLGILEEDAAFIEESVKKFILATHNLVPTNVSTCP